MQLDNPNGQVITLDKIDINRNKVVYSKFDFGGENGKFLKQTFLEFVTIKLEEYLTQEIIFEELCYNTIVIEAESGYATSEEVQNWLYPVTKVRVYIPALIINQVANTASQLYSLIEIYAADNVARLLEGTHYYRDKLTDDEIDTLTSYPGIQIEDKI